MILKFIFIVGVEGCGHHGLMPVIDAAVRQSVRTRRRDSRVFTRWGVMRELFNELWYSDELLLEKKERLRSGISYLMSYGAEQAKLSGCPQYILEDNSFPSGSYRSVSRQWNITEISELLRPYADVKILGLYRNPVAMTFSHPEFDGGIRNHAKVLATFLEYLNDKLIHLDASLVRVIHYEDLIENQDKLAGPLAEYLGLDECDIKAGLKHVRKSTKNWVKDMNAGDKEWLLNYFSPDRLQLWPIFNDSKRNIIRNVADTFK